MFFGGARTPVHATTTCPDGAATCLAGWAWSSNIGWVSFNSSDDSGTTAHYDVAMDTSGNLTGYAWSSNVGWISFNSSDLQALPACSGTVPPTVNTNTGAVIGWARVVSEIGRKNSSNNSIDGWDGCIELSNSATHASPDISGNSGTTYVSSSNTMNGYAWGGNVMGWLKFNVTCSNCTTTLSDLVFLGTNASSTQSNSVVYDLPSASGSVTIPLQWTVNNATNIAIASTSHTAGVSTDWGVNSGSTVTAHSIPLGASGTDTINFSTAGTKILTLSYKLSGVIKYKTVQVVVNPYVPVVIPINTCKQPANVVLPACGASDSGTATTVTQCQSPAPACQYQCLTGRHPQNNMCVKSSIQEI
jgi:hypothetical protein